MMLDITSGRATVAFSVIILALLFPPTTTDRATWQQCKHGWDGRGRVLEFNDPDVNLLNLENCNITVIPPDGFNITAPKLKEIHLSGNSIQEIDPTVFIPVSHITWLFLSGNKLRYIPVFGAHSLFPNLQGLHLDNNKITSINDIRIFSACDQLEYLYLDGNEIEHISPGVFNSLTNLESLHLSNNKLTSIYDSIFNINSLKTVWLDNNLIEYVSPNAFGELRNLHIHVNQLSFLPTNFASIFAPPPKGAIASMTSFYNNPFQCSCLLELLADMRRAKSGVKYARWEYNGKLRSCVYLGRVECNRIYL